LSAAGVLRPSGRGKVSSVALPSSVGLEEGAFVASSVATKSAHAVVPSDAFVVVSLVIGRGSVVFALLLLTITLRALALALRSRTARRYVCRCCQDPHLDVAMI